MKTTVNRLTATFLVGGLLLTGLAVAAAGWPGSTDITNWYGGPAYLGKPELALTAAFVRAGGGPGHFSIQKALVAMLGKKTVNAELAKLTTQYGKHRVTDFIDGMNYAVADGLKRATTAGVRLPPAPGNLTGTALAKAMVRAGTAPGGTFWAGELFDHLLSHGIHNQVMADADKARSGAFDRNLHRLTNQALFDVAHALGMNGVKLASLH